MLWPKRLACAGYAAALLAASGGWPLGWSSLAISGLIPILAAHWLLAAQVSRRLRRFDQALVEAVKRDDLGALLPLFRRQWLLRFAAAPHQMLSKLGFIYRKLGDHHAAIRALRGALEDAPPHLSPAIVQSLGDASFAIGDVDQAERMYRSSQRGDRVDAGVCVRIAELIRRRGGDPNEALRFLRQAVDASRQRAELTQLRCRLVEALVDTGHVSEARWHLARVEEEIAQGATCDGDLADRCRELVQRH